MLNWLNFNHPVKELIWTVRNANLSPRTLAVEARQYDHFNFAVTLPGRPQ
jgi:hypothetical protein